MYYRQRLLLGSCTQSVARIKILVGESTTYAVGMLLTSDKHACFRLYRYSYL